MGQGRNGILAPPATARVVLPDDARNARPCQIFDLYHLLATVTFLDDFTADLKGGSVMNQAAPAMFNTAHVLAQIRQDPDTHEISLSDVRIDTEAHDFLSDTLLEAAEPWILQRLEGRVLLEPSVPRARAERMLNNTLGSAGIGIGLNALNVTHLEPGPGHLRGLVTATGTVDVSVPADYLTLSD